MHKSSPRSRNRPGEDASRRSLNLEIEGRQEPLVPGGHRSDPPIPPIDFSLTNQVYAQKIMLSGEVEVFLIQKQGIEMKKEQDSKELRKKKKLMYIKPRTKEHEPKDFVAGNSEAGLYQTYYY